jgi:predicted dehydrogenase
MVRVGLLGGGFIGQMHALAFTMAKMSTWQPSIDVELKVVADKNPNLRREVGARYGFERSADGWEEAATADDIDLFVNAGPNDLHAAPSIAAAEAGKAVFCEKPLAGSADEAYRLWKAVEKTGAVNLCAFMYRSLPALNLAREMIRAGELGEIRHFRSRFLLNMLDGGPLSWRFDKRSAGLGAIGDLGSHHVDQARFLVGEIASVAAMTGTWSRDSAGLITEVNDDAFVCAARFENGATASFEASRVASGHNLGGYIEVDGTKGSVSFHMERLNELVIAEPKRGPRTQLVTQTGHPYADFWLPIGIQGQHPIGWNELFGHQARHMLEAIVLGKPVSPRATFEDGYRVAETVEAIARSAETRGFVDIKFRT